MAIEPDYVLDEIGEAAVMGRVHDAPARLARTRPDLTWHEFVKELHESSTDDGTKAVIVAVVLAAEGHKGGAVDWDAVAASVGKKPSTMKNMRPRLRRLGWLEGKAALNDAGHPVLQYVTARSVG